MKLIVETAFNHGGSPEILSAICDEVVKVAPDFVTVQAMVPDHFCDSSYDKFELYQTCSIELEVFHKELQRLQSHGIESLICALDNPSFDFFFERGYRNFKLHATDISNIDCLKKLGNTPGIRVFLETQVSTLFEVERAAELLGENLECVLHGYSDYPTEKQEINLASLDFFRDEFPGVKVGLADHSRNESFVPAMCVAKGIDFLELHITNGRHLRNFDWQVSYDANELLRIKANIRDAMVFNGTYTKRIQENESAYREVIHKKHLPGEGWMRSNRGMNYWDEQFSSDSEDVAIAVIARLDSRRLVKKVLRPLSDTDDVLLLPFLMERLNRSFDHVAMLTSKLSSDDELADVVKQHGFEVYRSSPNSVVDRLLLAAHSAKAGYVIRVTGDNPYTDPTSVEDIINTVKEHNLDYCRCINVPLGTSAEIFRVSKLWDLYKGGMDPATSEYISWFALEDERLSKGIIHYNDFEDGFGLLRCTVDYMEDLQSARDIFRKAKDSDTEIDLRFIHGNKQLLRDESNAMLKLPNGRSVSLVDYHNMWIERSTVVRMDYRK